MNFSDQVRKHCADNYVASSRAKGETQVILYAGKIHSDLGFSNRLPLVCSALGTKRFEEENNLRRKAINGPLNGASTEFVFDLL